MLGNEYTVENVACEAANSDLGAAAAYELWATLSAVKSCADYSEDLNRYETSLFRFPLAQRQLLAALEYLGCVEANGHQAYFASAASFGFAEAVSCFQSLGREDVVQNLQAALASYQAQGAVAVGQTHTEFSELGGFDRDLAAANPIADLFRFSRRNQLEFISW